jgi:hypothetical protein
MSMLVPRCFVSEEHFFSGTATIIYSLGAIGDRVEMRAFLTTVMSLLSLFVFWLGWMRSDVLWSWMGFICSLISGVFVQMFIDRRKTNHAHR